jgi:hypothetical protein
VALAKPSLAQRLIWYLRGSVGFMGLHEITDQLKPPFGTDAYKEVIGPNDHPLLQQTYQLRFRGQREEVGHPGRFAQPLSDECLIERWMVCERLR